MKILLKAFLLTTPINFAYAAEGQKSAGLPQMDIATFPSQLFWLVITFSLLYLFMWKFVIPRLGATIEERRDKISNDINDADNLNTEATDILKKYDEVFMNKDEAGMNEVLHDDYKFTMHASGKVLTKQDVIQWAMSDDINRDKVRIIYENDEIGIEHSFVTFSDGNTQAVMAVFTFKDGKIFSLETGATNMPK